MVLRINLLLFWNLMKQYTGICESLKLRKTELKLYWNHIQNIFVYSDCEHFSILVKGVLETLSEGSFSQQTTPFQTNYIAWAVFLRKSWWLQSAVLRFNKKTYTTLSKKAPHSSLSCVCISFNTTVRKVLGRTSDLTGYWCPTCQLCIISGERFSSLRHPGHYSVQQHCDVTTRHKNQMPANC